MCVNNIYFLKVIGCVSSRDWFRKLVPRPLISLHMYLNTVQKKHIPFHSEKGPWAHGGLETESNTDFVSGGAIGHVTRDPRITGPKSNLTQLAIGKAPSLPGRRRRESSNCRCTLGKGYVMLYPRSHAEDSQHELERGFEYCPPPRPPSLSIYFRLILECD